MTINPLDSIAPVPTSVDEVTIESLLRYETVAAFTQELHASDLCNATFSGDQTPETMRSYAGAVNLLAYQFAVAFLLRSVREVAPDRADEIAQHLHGLWQDGGSFAECLFDWLVEEGLDPDAVKRAVTEQAEAAA